MTSNEVLGCTQKVTDYSEEESSNACVGKVLFNVSNGTTADHPGLQAFALGVVSAMAFDVKMTSTQLRDKNTSCLSEKVTTDLNTGSIFLNNGEQTCSMTLFSIEECCKESAKQTCGEVEMVCTSSCNVCCDVAEVPKKVQKEGTFEDELKDGEIQLQKSPEKPLKSSDEVSSKKEKETTIARNGPTCTKTWFDLHTGWTPLHTRFLQIPCFDEKVTL